MNQARSGGQMLDGHYLAGGRDKNAKEHDTIKKITLLLDNGQTHNSLHSVLKVCILEL